MNAMLAVPIWGGSWFFCTNAVYGLAHGNWPALVFCGVMTLAFAGWAVDMEGDGDG